jgi:hypothetical protein
MNLRGLQIAHDHSTANRAELERSRECRCFYCLAIFAPAEIREWIADEGGDTAVCPRCGVDSVIGSASGVSLSDSVFEEMQTRWFS